MKAQAISIASLLLATAGISADYTNYVRLFSFGGTNGATPYGSLIEGTDGRLYGVTLEGGLTNTAFPQGVGTVFRLNKDGSGFATIHYFDPSNNDGQRPSAALLEDKTTGTLYGTTMYGGVTNQGTIYQLNKDGSGYGIIRSFLSGADDGGNPQGGLLKASDGALYGTASDSSGGGQLFKIDANGSNYTVVCPLADNVGFIADSPAGSLIEGTNGVLYGVGLSGWMPWDPGEEINTQGAIFRLNKDGTGIGVDSSAFFANTGFPAMHPNGPLLDGGDGFIYGTVQDGVTPQRGCAFRISTGYYWNFDELSELSGIGGPIFQPSGGLIKGPDGNLYGTGSGADPHIIVVGQTPTYGGVFKLDVTGTNFTVLKVFGVSPDGETPQGSLLLASDGGIYGATSAGGDGGYGTLYALFADARSWFNNLTVNTNGSTTVCAVGSVGSTFRIQCTTNLSEPAWNDIGTNAANSIGQLNFNIIDATTSVRLYRLVTP